MLMILPYLRDKVNFFLNIFLIKNAEDLEKLGEKDNEKWVEVSVRKGVVKTIITEKKPKHLNRTQPRHINILKDIEKEWIILFHRQQHGQCGQWLLNTDILLRKFLTSGLKKRGGM